MIDNSEVKSKSQYSDRLSFTLDAIIHWRKFIFICSVISILISLFVALILPVQYKSTASVLPSEKADLLGSMEGISSLVKTFSPGRGLASLQGDNELDRYLTILKSDRVLTKVIKKFDLVSVYKITSYPREKTKKELLNNVEFLVEPEGNLSINVFDIDPVRAAEIANYLVEELNNTNSELQAQNAKANRIFIEERYNKNLFDLSKVEDSLKMFQKRHGIIALPEQMEASIKAVGELSAKLTVKEVELGIIERTLSENHPQVIATRIEIEELRKNILKMSEGQSKYREVIDLMIPFKNLPDLGSEYIRRYRDVEIQYKILQFLTPLYEQSKVEEQRQTPSVLMLDKAFPAERKARPKRSLIVLGGFFVGLFFSFAYVVIQRFWTYHKSENSNLYSSAKRFSAAITSDIRTSRISKIIRSLKKRE